MNPYESPPPAVAQTSLALCVPSMCAVLHLGMDSRNLGDPCAAYYPLADEIYE
jgi:hypothetical protein